MGGRGEREFETRFVWDHGGDEVFLCIFRDQQNLTLPMNKNSEGYYEVKTMLGQGRFEYCFSVDGKWTHDPDLPALRNQFGHYSNMIKIVDPLKVLESKKAKPEHLARTSSGVYSLPLEKCFSSDTINDPSFHNETLISLTESLIEQETKQICSDDDDDSFTDEDDFPDLDEARPGNALLIPDLVTRNTKSTENIFDIIPIKPKSLENDDQKMGKMQESSIDDNVSRENAECRNDNTGKFDPKAISSTFQTSDIQSKPAISESKDISLHQSSEVCKDMSEEVKINSCEVNKFVELEDEVLTKSDLISSSSKSKQKESGSGIETTAGKQIKSKESKDINSVVPNPTNSFPIQESMSNQDLPDVKSFEKEEHILDKELTKSSSSYSEQKVSVSTKNCQQIVLQSTDNINSSDNYSENILPNNLLSDESKTKVNAGHDRVSSNTKCDTVLPGQLPSVELSRNYIGESKLEKDISDSASEYSQQDKSHLISLHHIEDTEKNVFLETDEKSFRCDTSDVKEDMLHHKEDMVDGEKTSNIFITDISEDVIISETTPKMSETLREFDSIETESKSSEACIILMDNSNGMFLTDKDVSLEDESMNTPSNDVAAISLDKVQQFEYIHEQLALDDEANFLKEKLPANEKTPKTALCEKDESFDEKQKIVLSNKSLRNDTSITLDPEEDNATLAADKGDHKENKAEKLDLEGQNVNEKIEKGDEIDTNSANNNQNDLNNQIETQDKGNVNVIAAIDNFNLQTKSTFSHVQDLVPSKSIVHPDNNVIDNKQNECSANNSLPELIKTETQINKDESFKEYGTIEEGIKKENLVIEENSELNEDINYKQEIDIRSIKDTSKSVKEEEKNATAINVYNSSDHNVKTESDIGLDKLCEQNDKVVNVATSVMKASSQSEQNNVKNEHIVDNESASQKLIKTKDQNTDQSHEIMHTVGIVKQKLESSEAQKPSNVKIKDHESKFSKRESLEDVHESLNVAKTSGKEEDCQRNKDIDVLQSDKSKDIQNIISQDHEARLSVRDNLEGYVTVAGTSLTSEVVAENDVKNEHNADIDNESLKTIKAVDQSTGLSHEVVHLVDNVNQMLSSNEAQEPSNVKNKEHENKVSKRDRLEDVNEPLNTAQTSEKDEDCLKNKDNDVLHSDEASNIKGNIFQDHEVRLSVRDSLEGDVTVACTSLTTEVVEENDVMNEHNVCKKSESQKSIKTVDQSASSSHEVVHSVDSVKQILKSNEAHETSNVKFKGNEVKAFKKDTLEDVHKSFDTEQTTETEENCFKSKNNDVLDGDEVKDENKNISQDHEVRSSVSKNLEVIVVDTSLITEVLEEIQPATIKRDHEKTISIEISHHEKMITNELSKKIDDPQKEELTEDDKSSNEGKDHEKPAKNDILFNLETKKIDLSNLSKEDNLPSLANNIKEITIDQISDLEPNKQCDETNKDVSREEIADHIEGVKLKTEDIVEGSDFDSNIQCNDLNKIDKKILGDNIAENVEVGNMKNADICDKKDSSSQQLLVIPAKESSKESTIVINSNENSINSTHDMTVNTDMNVKKDFEFKGSLVTEKHEKTIDDKENIREDICAERKDSSKLKEDTEELKSVSRNKKSSSFIFVPSKISSEHKMNNDSESKLHELTSNTKLSSTKIEAADTTSSFEPADITPAKNTDLSEKSDTFQIVTDISTKQTDANTPKRGSTIYDTKIVQNKVVEEKNSSERKDPMISIKNENREDIQLIRDENQIDSCNVAKLTASEAKCSTNAIDLERKAKKVDTPVVQENTILDEQCNENEELCRNEPSLHTDLKEPLNIGRPDRESTGDSEGEKKSLNSDENDNSADKSGDTNYIKKLFGFGKKILGKTSPKKTKSETSIAGDSGQDETKCLEASTKVPEELEPSSTLDNANRSVIDVDSRIEMTHASPGIRIEDKAEKTIPEVTEPFNIKSSHDANHQGDQSATEHHENKDKDGEEFKQGEISQTSGIAKNESEDNSTQQSMKEAGTNVPKTDVIDHTRLNSKSVPHDTNESGDKKELIKAQDDISSDQSKSHELTVNPKDTTDSSQSTASAFDNEKHQDDMSQQLPVRSKDISGEKKNISIHDSSSERTDISKVDPVHEQGKESELDDIKQTEKIVLSNKVVRKTGGSSSRPDEILINVTSPEPEDRKDNKSNKVKDLFSQIKNTVTSVERSKSRSELRLSMQGVEKSASKSKIIEDPSEKKSGGGKSGYPHREKPKQDTKKEETKHETKKAELKPEADPPLIESPLLRRKQLEENREKMTMKLDAVFAPIRSESVDDMKTAIKIRGMGDIKLKQQTTKKSTFDHNRLDKEYEQKRANQKAISMPDKPAKFKKPKPKAPPKEPTPPPKEPTPVKEPTPKEPTPPPPKEPSPPLIDLSPPEESAKIEIIERLSPGPVLAPRLGINGFDTMGRMVFRAALEAGINVVAVNDSFVPVSEMVAALKFDLSHSSTSRCRRKLLNVEESPDAQLVVNGKKVVVLNEMESSVIPWEEYGINYVVETLPTFNTYNHARQHIRQLEQTKRLSDFQTEENSSNTSNSAIYAGVERVIIASQSPDAKWITVGVNDLPSIYREKKILSHTTGGISALATILKVVDEGFGIDFCSYTLMKAVMGPTRDIKCPTLGPKTHARLSRWDFKETIVPCSAPDLEEGVYRVFPEIQGRLTGMLVYTPVPEVSMLDITMAVRKSSKDIYREICLNIKERSQTTHRGVIKYIMASSNENSASCVHAGSPESVVFDARAGLQINSNTVKLVMWFDNETGFASRVVDLVNNFYKHLSNPAQ